MNGHKNKLHFFYSAAPGAYKLRSSSENNVRCEFLPAEIPLVLVDSLLQRLKKVYALVMQRYTEVTALLKELYEDKDGQRKEEIAALSGPNEFAEFYARLKGIKEFHKKHPNEVMHVFILQFFFPQM